MSITVFITLQGFVSSLSVADSANDSHMGDYSLANEGLGFSADDLTMLETNENVESVAAMQFSSIRRMKISSRMVSLWTLLYRMESISRW